MKDKENPKKSGKPTKPENPFENKQFQDTVRKILNAPSDVHMGTLSNSKPKKKQKED